MPLKIKGGRTKSNGRKRNTALLLISKITKQQFSTKKVIKRFLTRIIRKPYQNTISGAYSGP